MSEEPLRFDGRTAIVTGGARGVGRACVELLARRGAHVVLNDTGGASTGAPLEQSLAHETAMALRAEGLDVVACTADAAEAGGAATVIDTARQRHGRVDVIVANAGVSWAAPLPTISAEDVARMWAVNAVAPLALTQAAWETMLSHGGGRVVTLSSAGVFGFVGRAHYVMSKAAVLGLTRSIALEGAPVGITANCVLPWAVTRLAVREPSPWMTEHLSPEAVAAGIAWLAHPSCPSSGDAYGIEGRRMVRVALAVNDGIVAHEATPEAFAKQWDSLRSESRWRPPDSTAAYTRDEVRPALGYPTKG
jgi:NAD(P)-dependent dehydrogenase (short-subunit alcohol dehydrogenase family)